MQYQPGVHYLTPFGFGMCTNSTYNDTLAPGWYINAGTVAWPDWQMLAQIDGQPALTSAQFSYGYSYGY